jgi:subtilisin-like proprotein convertase family protein
MHAPVDLPLSEFFLEPDYAAVFVDDADYQAFFDAPPPVSLGDTWLLLTQLDRRPFGTTYVIDEVAVEANCTLTATIAVTELADNCDNFSYTRVGPAGASFDAPFSPPDPAPSLTSMVTPFDCAQSGVGDFEDCSEQQWCAPGLICAGITRSNGGLCMDASLRGEFASGNVNAPIPDSDVLVAMLDASDLATVDTDVVVSIELEHPDPSALTITLTNPSNNEVMVWDQEPSPYDLSWYPDPGSLMIARVPQGFSGDESVNGTWILTITDDAGGGGTLVAWGLEIMSRFD